MCVCYNTRSAFRFTRTQTHSHSVCDIPLSRDGEIHSFIIVFFIKHYYYYLLSISHVKAFNVCYISQFFLIDHFVKYVWTMKSTRIIQLRYQYSVCRPISFCIIDWIYIFMFHRKCGIFLSILAHAALVCFCVRLHTLNTEKCNYNHGNVRPSGHSTSASDYFALFFKSFPHFHNHVPPKT